MRKPRILFLYDVPNGGAEERGKKLKEHLSDDFDIDLVSDIELSNLKYVIPTSYDIYYLAFHTMLVREEIQKLPKNKVLCMITGRHIIKDIFINNANKISKLKREQLKAEGHDLGFPADFTYSQPKTTPEQYFREISKICCGITVNNKIAYRELSNFYSGPKFYVPRGVDTDVFKPLIPYPRHSFNLCYVGKNVPEKGLEKIIRPLAIKTKSGLIENTRIGNDALNKQKMCMLYNNCSVYIVASSIDGTPNPMLEAAACGRPIISNKIGNAIEFIQPGVNGFLILKHGNMEEYIEKVLGLKRHPDVAEKMGLAARETVLNGGTWRHSMEYERNTLKELTK